MKTVKQLRDSADKERQKAASERKEAAKKQDKANSFTGNIDPNIPLQLSNEAQQHLEKAALHDKNAMDFDQEAGLLERDAIALESKKQQILTTAQNEADSLDTQARGLRG